MPHWLVIDLEATTDEGGWPVTEMEIIEIGATLVDRAGREQDHFQRFVKPFELGKGGSEVERDDGVIPPPFMGCSKVLHPRFKIA